MFLQEWDLPLLSPFFEKSKPAQGNNLAGAVQPLSGC
jgi:hypothetical protein